MSPTTGQADSRVITAAEAINEALHQAMEADPRVLVLGEGVPDPKGIFGTTLGLRQRFGAARVLDMPVAENGMTGIAIGAAIVGMRPVMTHQRMDFALLALDQLVNNAAKWHTMFGGRMTVPLVVRMVIGRGWGQGPQHSQSLQAMLAHVPGLKVVMPSTPRDAKALLLAAIADENPVMFLEHRWLHNVRGHVGQSSQPDRLGTARLARIGSDVTIAATSYMVLEALAASRWLGEDGIDAEVLDLRTLRPLDRPALLQSVRKTGRLLAADTGWSFCGFAAELIATVTEGAFDRLQAPPRRVALPDVSTPTSHAVARHYYPRAVQLYRSVCQMFDSSPREVEPPRESTALDVPDSEFQGPF
jgi:pyruvate dehydrogenase E1 component beta subunit